MRSVGTLSLLVVWITLCVSSAALSQTLPSLADELRAAITEGGEAGVRQRFDEIWPDHKDDYSVDTQALMMLTSETLMSGDQQLAQTLADIQNVVLQDLLSSQLNFSQEDLEAAARDMKGPDAAQEAATAAEVQRVQDQQLVQQRGKPRDDLARFTGLYGELVGPPQRRLFVTTSCDGFLVVGALWADVAPWWMRSASDGVFTYADSFTQLALEFTFDDEDQAAALSHDLEGLPTPLQRVGDLPPEYAQCLERKAR